jgi:hypothetical protein
MTNFPTDISPLWLQYSVTPFSLVDRYQCFGGTYITECCNLNRCCSALHCTSFTPLSPPEINSKEKKYYTVLIIYEQEIVNPLITMSWQLIII